MTGAVVLVERLGVRFPGRSAPSLCDVDLEVASGERVLVVGPSGGGKSTLLHTLTGVVPQSVAADVTGRVRVLGADPVTTPVPRTALSVGWLGQDPAAGVCLPTVEDEVALPLENRGVPRAQIDGRVAAGLASVGALHLRRRRVGTLSGGEQQRVALASVLAGDPAVLLLDEPTSMLDPVSAAQVLELLGEVSATRTTLLVEHRLAEMSWSPERAVVLDAAGRVVRDGRTADVLTDRGPTSVRADAQSRTTTAAVPRDRRTPEVVLRLRDATVSRGTEPVVEGLDLDLRRGSVTVVVGPNGSGKSSLLLGLAGFLPTSGLTGCADVGLVFQRPELQFLARTVESEVGYGLRLAAGRTKVAAAATRLRVDAALVDVGLDGLAAADPFRLSGGQQRRLSVVSMAVLDRPVLLLDEPTFGLDREQTTRLVALVDRLARAGTAVVLATHDLALASALADQVLALRDGIPVAVGTRELLHDDAVLAGAGLLAGVPGC